MGHCTGLKPGCASVEAALAQGPGTRTYWRLTASITVCLAHGRAIFLDVARNRYQALPAACEPAFIDWLSAPDGPPPERCRESLTAMDVADGVRVAGLRPIACPVSMPVPLDAEPLAPQRVSSLVILALARTLLRAWRDVRSYQLHRALERPFARAAHERPCGDDLSTRLAMFRSARPLIPVPRACLHDCLALVEWLGPTARGAELVLGVSPYPFSAHCWVQLGGRVIDDHPQSPSRYHPILRLP